MHWNNSITAVTLICILLTGCNTEKVLSEHMPNVVTADIQAGIEKHIEEQTKLGDGYFKIPFENQ